MSEVDHHYLIRSYDQSNEIHSYQEVLKYLDLMFQYCSVELIDRIDIQKILALNDCEIE